MLIMLVVIRSAVAYMYSESLAQQLVAEAETVSVTINDIGKSGFDSARTRSIVKDLSKSLNARITLIRNDGKVVADSNANPTTMENHANRPEIKEAILGRTGISERFSKTLGYNMLYVAIPFKVQQSSAGVIRVAVPQSDVDHALKNINYMMFAIIVASMLLIIVTSNFISRSITVPLTRMKTMAERMSNDDLEQELPINSHDEIADLSKSLNSLAAQLKNRIEELRSEQAKAELILNNMTEGVILLDSDYKIILANPAAENIFEINEPAITGIKIREAIPVHDFTPLLNEAVLSNKEVADEFEFSAASSKNIRVLILPIADKSGEETGEERALIVVRDTTRAKQIERVRKDFVANVSHELKTPLTGLKLLSETLKRSVDDEDKKATKNFVEKLDKELTRIISMVRELIDLSKLESNPDVQSKEWVNLGELVYEIGNSFNELAQSKNLNLVLDIQPASRPTEIPLVYGYRNQLQTLARNLIDNAIRYTTSDGRIDVKVKHDTRTVDLVVSDTGIGLAAREIPRIFERFYRVDKARSRETGGTGLGLSIVKHISENHDATLSVNSKLGVGSTFSVRFNMQER
jgi:two-component system phosphate regulon sensor histidine kinase PhoR